MSAPCANETHAEGDRHAGIDRQRLQAAEVIAHPLGVALDVLLRDLEHAGAQLAHHADQLPDFVPIRETARDRAAVGRLMIARCARW